MTAIAGILLCFNLYQLALDQSELNTAHTNVSIFELIGFDFFYFALWFRLTVSQQLKSCYNLVI